MSQIGGEGSSRWIDMTERCEERWDRGWECWKKKMYKWEELGTLLPWPPPHGKFPGGNSVSEL